MILIQFLQAIQNAIEVALHIETAGKTYLINQNGNTNSGEETMTGELMKAVKHTQLIAERNNLISTKCKCIRQLKLKGVCECGRQERLMQLNHEICNLNADFYADLIIK